MFSDTPSSETPSVFL